MMGILLGLDVWTLEVFEDDSASLQEIESLEVTGVIVDEISIRTKTDQGTGNVREANWNNDTIMIARFNNTLEAGNLSNEGVNISKFRIVRREVDQDQNADIQLGEVEFLGGDVDLEFIDGSIPNRGLVYTIIPVGENDLDGTPREVVIQNVNMFNGVWVYDKDTQETLVFDKAIGSVSSIESSLVQNRTVIETFAPLPQIYSNSTAYHQFSLTSVFLPEEFQRSGDIYMSILNKFIKQNKQFLVKLDSGLTYVGNLSNVRTTTPQVTWSAHDYIQVSVDFTETDTVENYMKGE